MDIGLLLLRLTVGLALAAHGAQKLFGWFGGHGLDGTAPFMEMLGFYPGRRHALRAATIEFGGGILLAVGLVTPLAGALVASVMLVASLTAHAGKGFFIMNGGYEYPLVIGMVGSSVAFTGPGAVSIDAVLGFADRGVVWGIGAAVVALFGAGMQLAQRRSTPAAQTA